MEALTYREAVESLEMAWAQLTFVVYIEFAEPALKYVSKVLRARFS